MPKGQDFFSIPELFLGLVLLSTIGVVLRALSVLLADRRTGRHRSLRMLRGLVIGLGAYFATVFLISLVPPEPPQATPLGNPLCLAHRCMAIETVLRRTAGSTTTYELTLLLTNSSRYPMRDVVSGVYLLDDRGQRYPSVPNAAEPSLGAELAAYSAATTKRAFAVPSNAHVAGFVVDRGMVGPRLRCLVIGGNCWHPRQPEPPALIE
jgi:hypothetical protein